MSKSALKATAKAQRKEKAIKKAIRKKALIIGICALVVIVALVFTFFPGFLKNNNVTDAETYSHRGQTVHLFSDGKFTANMAHGVRKSGTYTKTAEDGRTAVTFNADGRADIGWIINNALHTPEEWEDGHSHGNILPLVNKK